MNFIIIQLFMNVNYTPKKEKPSVQNLPSVKISPVKVPTGAKQIGNYILGKTIGTGTYGKVHLGLHIPTGERVAVKIIDKTKLYKKDLERIHRQIDILKRIMHPSLIQLYEIIETEKSLLFVTEYMQNGELFNYIIQRKKLSEDEARTIFHQLIEGVEYMHQIGIAHRDLKPENILIDYNGKVKIIDFGLSNTYSKNQKLKTQCGSPCYVAPQMIQGKHRYDPLFTDIWSSGIVLFAMVAGYLPFCDPDTSKLFQKILTGSFKSPSWVSDDCKDLIEKILNVNPNKRATISEIKDHAWYRKQEIKKIVGIDTRYYKIPYDMGIIQNMEKLGLNLSNFTSSIQKNMKNKQTALYYLIAKKMVKDGHKIVSYIGCDDFQPQLLIQLQIQDQNIESTHVDVQSVSPIPVQQADLNTPETNSGVLFNLRSSQFQSILDDFMSSKSQKDDTKTTLMKDKFYANNLENKRKKQDLKINHTIFPISKQQKTLNLLKVYKRAQSFQIARRQTVLPAISKAYKLIETLETAETLFRPRKTANKKTIESKSKPQTRIIF